MVSSETSVSATPAGDAQRPDLVVLADPTSAVAEAYRALRTSVKFARGASDQPVRAILLADTGTGAGRATIAANLAGALAAAGDTTLLIDADLRQPGQHRLFGLPNERGVVTFLRGDDRTLPLQATGLPGLSLLTAGLAPFDAAELLASARFQLLLAQAREAAEFVIIDAPPVTAVADALAIAAAVDGVLLIVRAGRTRRVAAQRAKEQLLRVGANLLGVVLADARLTRGEYRY